MSIIRETIIKYQNAICINGRDPNYVLIHSSKKEMIRDEFCEDIHVKDKNKIEPRNIMGMKIIFTDVIKEDDIIVLHDLINNP